MVKDKETEDDRAALVTDLHTFLILLHAASNRDLLAQMREEGLTLTQLQLLDRLRGGTVIPSVHQVGQMMGVTQQHGSRLVDELAQRGYVRRETDEHDVRRKHVVMTDEGRNVNVRLHLARRPAISKFVDGLTAEQRHDLRDWITPILHPEKERA